MIDYKSDGLWNELPIDRKIMQRISNVINHALLKIWYVALESRNQQTLGHQSFFGNEGYYITYHSLIFLTLRKPCKRGTSTIIGQFFLFTCIIRSEILSCTLTIQSTINRLMHQKYIWCICIFSLITWCREQA